MKPFIPFTDKTMTIEAFRSVLAASAMAFALSAASVEPALAEGLFSFLGKTEVHEYKGPKHAFPVPESLRREMSRKDMDIHAPILVRIFKQERKLEVWKRTRSGRFAHLKSYDIRAFSGDLGPKKREGDRQAPEGFYSVSPGQMNPASAYYLSFDIGYPNAFDRAHGRTGGWLMVHGGCSSRGCYAMTDEQIREIYALARDAFKGGQKAFQVQAYPFRLSGWNLALHSGNPNIEFWRMLKEGYDIFESTRLEPKVSVIGKRYVFSAPTTAVADVKGGTRAY